MANKSIPAELLVLRKVSEIIQIFKKICISTLILLGTFQQPHCYTSVTSQLQEAEGLNYT